MKAIVLLSGGLDSLVTLSMALKAGRQILTLSFDYGQRHKIEIEAARAIAEYYRVPNKLITIDPATFREAQCSLTGAQASSTYVPARNTLFLAYAAGQAEIFGADEIYIGANKADRTGYPDCRPEFIRAFQGVLDCAILGSPKIVTPLTDLEKSEVVKLGMELSCPLELSWSCYNPQKTRPCLVCDACKLRIGAFKAVADEAEKIRSHCS
jgi:7-cyano-7-deazaguanine synthase